LDRRIKMLEREIGLIRNSDIRDGTKKIVDMLEDWYRTYPPSISGKYHKHELTMEKHIQDAVIFAEELIREFNIVGTDRDILLSGTILHDIGNSVKTFHGRKDEPGWKHYPASGWSQTGGGQQHPIDGAKIIEENPFYKSDEVAKLVRCHMSHWFRHCPQPSTFLEYCICTADYFATKMPQLKRQILGD